MPIYEFACNACGRHSSVFQRRMTSEVSAVCSHCQSSDLRRLISRFAVHRSIDDAFDDRALAGLDDDDPRAMARWARRMSEEMGEDLGPEFNQEISRLESGDDSGGGFEDDDLGDDGFGE